MLTSVMIDQAAELLGVSRRTVYYRIREGRLQTIRTLGGSQRVLLESIEALLREESGRVQRPRRWRFRYRPFREMPSALATASTLPWCSRSAALIISPSMRARVGISLSCRSTAISRPLAGGVPEDRERAEDVLRDGVRQQRRVRLGEGDHAAHLVLQLADVAGPAIEQQPLHRFFGDAQLALLEFVGGAGDEVVDEAGDLVAPLAQRRDREADDVEAVEEVFAEPAVADGVLEVGVGGGDDADVDGEGAGLAERRDFTRLEEAEQLGLEVEAELADFVEEEGAVAGGADQAELIAVGAGEGAAAVAEQLAFEQVARDGGAVERDEGLAARGRRSRGSRGRESPCRCRFRR